MWRHLGWLCMCGWQLSSLKPNKERCKGWRTWHVHAPFLFEIHMLQRCCRFIEAEQTLHWKWQRRAQDTIWGAFTLVAYLFGISSLWNQLPEGGRKSGPGTAFADNSSLWVASVHWASSPPRESLKINRMGNLSRPYDQLSQGCVLLAALPEAHNVTL